MQPAVVAADGVEYGALDAEPAQSIAQGAAPGRVVGEAAGVASGFEMHVEPPLADVNAGDDGGHTAGGRGLRSIRAARYTVRVHVPRLPGLY